MPRSSKPSVHQNLLSTATETWLLLLNCGHCLTFCFSTSNGWSPLLSSECRLCGVSCFCYGSLWAGLHSPYQSAMGQVHQSGQVHRGMMGLSQWGKWRVWVGSHKQGLGKCLLPAISSPKCPLFGNPLATIPTAIKSFKLPPLFCITSGSTELVLQKPQVSWPPTVLCLPSIQPF